MKSMRRDADTGCENYNVHSATRNDVTRTLRWGENLSFPSRLREYIISMMEQTASYNSQLIIIHDIHNRL